MAAPANGTITSGDGLINCDPLGTDCTETYDYGTAVVLTATPAAHYDFAAWSGDCVSGTNVCTLDMTAARGAGATFALQRFTLTVATPLNGTIMSGDGLINCDAAGTDCTETYDYDAAVVLTATPGVGHDFGAWSGDCVSGTNVCTLAMTAARSAGATFSIQRFALTVATPLNGTITSGDGLINCDAAGTDCTETYDYDAAVVLTATPGVGHDFAAWSGDCVSGTNVCTLAMTAPKAVAVTFSIQRFALTVATPLNGTITSGDGLINCDAAGTDCTETYDYDAAVVLTATPGVGHDFAAWSGDCVSGTNVCTLAMTAARSAGATFAIQRFALTVATPLNGAITSGDGLINCDAAGTDCAEMYDYGAAVVLTATPAAHYDFAAWSGDCTSGTNVCTLPMDGAKAAVATFAIQRFALTVATPANGTITSGDGQINCDPVGTDCTETYDYGTAVVLTATPSAHYDFAAWSGDCTSGTNVCNLTMDAAKGAGATFAIQRFALTVATPANGAITSGDGLISCDPLGTDCTETYDYGTAVVLTATPSAHYDFAAWSSDCTSSGTSVCNLTMDAAKGAGATFSIQRFALTVATPLNGTITSGDGLINCDAAATDCTETYDYNAAVVLTATPGVGHDFAAWSGDCVSGTNVCTLAMTAARSAGATFAIQRFALTVATPLNGTITSGDGLINCDAAGTDCTETYDYNAAVVLTATPGVGHDFAAWSGDCVSGTNVCTLAMTAARSAGATFAIQRFALTVATPLNGTITSGDGLINCDAAGTDCTETYDYNAAVVLTATPGVGHDFAAWSGDCVSGTNVCTLAMTAARSAGATFAIQRFALTVATPLNGTITSGDGLINCDAAGTDCTETYDYNAAVVLTATPGVGHDFAAWSGDCVSGTNVCTLAMTAARSAGATFAIQRFALTVATPLNGTITSGDGLINCDAAGTDCTETYDYNAAVVLTATPGVGHDFAAWSGDCVSGTNVCTLAMTAAKAAGATFAIQRFTLTVATPLNGAITSGDGLINCDPVGTDCTETYDYNAAVVLTATPGVGHDFTAWSGDCVSGTNVCTLAMTAARSAGATFAIQRFALTVATPLNGAITSGDGLINCDAAGTDCTETYDYNAAVVLTATPGAGHDFAAWSGDCVSGTNVCTLAMTAARSAGATFAIQRFALTVATPLNGTITSGDGLINCDPAGTDCTETYDYNAAVVLTATPGVGHDFAAWSGDCVSGTNVCTLAMTAARSAGATFAIQRFTLTVATPVNGTITSGDGLINCDAAGTDCTETYDYNAAVVLTATPGAGHDFAAWSGDCVSGTNVCTLAMTAAKAAGATFAIQRFTLTVATPLNGAITSGDGLINCDAAGTDCTETYDYNAAVVLTATPGVGHDFAAWSGDCVSGTNVCTLAMTAAKAAGATFAIQRFALTVATPLNGTITSGDGLINCDAAGTDCTETYDYNAAVVLTATPGAGHDFAAWSGDCVSGTNVCTLAMTAARSAGATFAIQRFALTVATPLNGTITSGDGLINCDAAGTDCTETYDYNAAVVLTATPGVGHDFMAWSGDCVSGTNVCTLAMTAARSAGATFAIQRFALTVATPLNGAITSGDGLINCDPLGTDCTETYDYGTAVVLTATPGVGHDFAAWSGDCVSGTNVCTLAMTAAKGAGATFAIQRFALTVATPLNGAITSGDGLINCDPAGTDCTETYDYNAAVVLTATPGVGHDFAAWSGDCVSGTNVCTLAMTAARSAGATFAIQRFTLTVATPLNGAITSGDGLINCDAAGTDCTETYDYNAAVVLTATPGVGHDFAAWSGDCVSGTNVCTLAMTAAKAAGATFAIQRFTLTVATPLNGTITGEGINCDPAGTDCTETYDYNAAVVLTATPGAGHDFAAWSGDCVSGTNVCTLAMTAARSAGATFSIERFTLTVATPVNGTITSGDGLINCDAAGTDCTETYDYNAAVVLTATPGVGHDFAAWSGDCVSGTNVCTLAMTAARSAGATFAIQRVALTVATPVNGTITSGDGLINCDAAGTDCTETYDYNAAVVLTATPGAGHDFAAWSGDCVSGTNVCTLAMTAARSAGATFCHPAVRADRGDASERDDHVG